ncbi:RsmB/NOP family class I SAM-dependent RNA methyltransferase [Alteraurantiacibacter aquimixticola]|uniref:Methyltransferase domain-containing protein n=1 Tax=Alteraurantiacibacter aquimixticola TaxID=2489173 RepID=A0A4T3EY15_9SPHN|nr:RsmB/NOP family class I SAM-dependent RNA methyltransferase [Alteraurantiacibacter aquimixticola]TIX49529.1 methyltransferase domain-containing protein [Alteraurantiacibacter aquimixticola]
MAKRPQFLTDTPAGFPARRGALKLLDAVLRRGETLDVAERAALKGVDGFADRALARALAGEALRWLADLDALIDSATRKRLPDDAKPRMVLRLMLAGWLRLDTPPHAVIATGLPLLDGGPRRLAHGVFSTLTRKQVTLPEVPTLPDRVLARWGELAQEIAPAIAAPPPLDLTLRDWSQTDELAAKLGGESLAPGHIRLPRGVAVEKLEGFEEGAFWVQDLAASLPARLLGEGAARRVLDLCAAPGGKTLQLAAAGWKVTALDISDKRLERLRENLARTQLSADIVVADALEWEPEEGFDAVLLDAPCTATGTCRRHPDVLHRIGGRHIAEMAELQSLLLARAARCVKPGGRLVYATCSLEPEEGEQQAGAVELVPDPVNRDELPDGLMPGVEGWVRTHPGMLLEKGGLDGFFIARWKPQKS